MTDPIEAMAAAICVARDGDEWDALVTDYDRELATAAYAALRETLVPVPWQPTEAQWGGLARAIVMWLDFEPKTPRTLFRHLEMSGHEIPQWLRDEPEMQNLDHVPSKGTRAAIIYKAMLDAYALPEIKP